MGMRGRGDFSSRGDGRGGGFGGRGKFKNDILRQQQY